MRLHQKRDPTTQSERTRQKEDRRTDITRKGDLKQQMLQQDI